MAKLKNTSTVIGIFSLLFAGTGLFVFAGFDHSICYKPTVIDEKCEKISDDECMDILEECENYFGKEQARLERDITTTEAEKESLEYQISRLQGEINHLTAQINRNRTVIQNLGLKIADTQDSIIRTTEKIGKSREEISEILRTMHTEGRLSTMEILLMEEDLSSIFVSLNSLERLSDETGNILDEVRELRSSLQGYKENLEEDKEATERTARMQELQKAEEEAARRRQEELHDMTEEEYRKQMVEKEDLEERRREIEERRLQLVGIPEVDMPTFTEALEVAEWVEGVTGIRPAFLLSIIMQESALGRNVGQCYIVDKVSGRTKGINNGRVYTQGIAAPQNHSSRNDLEEFLSITGELNKDPLQTPVSCTMIRNGSEYGYGGAMGPAQFIPTTWNSRNVRPKVTSILGKEPNPWKIKDSFLASGIYLAFRGGGSPKNELSAAAGYFGQEGIGYESTVMRRATCIQTFLDDEVMTDACRSLVFMP